MEIGLYGTEIGLCGMEEKMDIDSQADQNHFLYRYINRANGKRQRLNKIFNELSRLPDGQKHKLSQQRLSAILSCNRATIQRDLAPFVDSGMIKSSRGYVATKSFFVFMDWMAKESGEENSKAWQDGEMGVAENALSACRPGNKAMSTCGRIYAFTGTHGTGKTTAVYELAAWLKRTRPGQEVGIVSEVARLCPYPICGRAAGARVDDAAQRWIFAAQVRAELDALANYHWVVSDRTVCDCIAYTRAGGLESLARAMMMMAAGHVRVYQEVYMLRCADIGPAADDGVRSTDEAFRQRVEDELITIYHQIGVAVSGQPQKEKTVFN
jgi:predicted ATPase